MKGDRMMSVQPGVPRVNDSFFIRMSQGNAKVDATEVSHLLIFNEPYMWKLYAINPEL